MKIEKLDNESQFALWCFQLKLLLMTNDMLNVVTGNKLQPEDSVNAQTEWIRKDARAQRLIVTPASTKVMLHIIHCRSCF